MKFKSRHKLFLQKDIEIFGWSLYKGTELSKISNNEVQFSYKTNDNPIEILISTEENLKHPQGPGYQVSMSADNFLQCVLQLAAIPVTEYFDFGLAQEFGVSDDDGYQNGHETVDQHGKPIPFTITVSPPSKIKKVFCPYNYDLVVYDTHNNRVSHLCGKLTKEKFYELMNRSSEQTVFEGAADFKCVLSDMGLISRTNDLDDNIAPILIAMEQIQEHSKKIQPTTFPVNLFGGTNVPTPLDKPLDDSDDRAVQVEPVTHPDPHPYDGEIYDFSGDQLEEISPFERAIRAAVQGNQAHLQRERLRKSMVPKKMNYGNV